MYLYFKATFSGSREFNIYSNSSLKLIGGKQSKYVESDVCKINGEANR
jgi:hypothetical protein